MSFVLNQQNIKIEHQDFYVHYINFIQSFWESIHEFSWTLTKIEQKKCVYYHTSGWSNQVILGSACWKSWIQHRSLLLCHPFHLLAWTSKKFSNWSWNEIPQPCVRRSHLLKIKKLSTSPYHIQCNGFLERSHRTLWDYLRSFVQKSVKFGWIRTIFNVRIQFKHSLCDRILTLRVTVK